MLCNVNIWAVIVSAVVSMGIGAIWYSKALFGNTWMALTGQTSMNPDASKGMWKLYLGQFIATLVTTFILARTLFLSQTAGVAYSMIMAFWLWLGFVAAVTIGMVLWDRKPFKFFAITAGCTLVSLLVSAAILAVW